MTAAAASGTAAGTASAFLRDPLVCAATRMGFGALGLSQGYGPSDRAEAMRVLSRLAARGAAFIDTSDSYGSAGHNELLLGDWLRADAANRARAFVCTKFGVRSLAPPVICGTPEYVRTACAASLQRLGVDCIDLYYQHRVDPDTPIEDTVGAMAGLVKEGKVRYIGLSEANADTIRRAHKVHPIAAVQVEYSPWEIGIERNGVLDTCRELGIAIVAFSPLGRGFLTGRYSTINDFDADDSRRHHPRFMGDNFSQNLKLVEAIKQLAGAKGCTAAQFVLAWVMAQGPDFIPIPGTKTVSRLEENLGSLEVQISKDDDARVRAILDEFGVAGERYPPALLALSWK
ncbi:hypothetical protein HDU82_004256 [Entophlyctis luteolus]|nr:hypothetical protein HDU82_004256 [Entophlyctis luteolus]